MFYGAYNLFLFIISNSLYESINFSVSVEQKKKVDLYPFVDDLTIYYNIIITLFLSKYECIKRVMQY